MIFTIAEKITIRLLEGNQISNEDFEVIRYGLFSVISKLLYGLISIITGILFNCIFESIVFYFSFLYVKKYAGGIHATTEQRCFIYSTVSIICSICCIYLSLSHHIVGALLIVLATTATIFMIMIVPVCSSEIQLSELDRKLFAKKTIIRVTILICVAIISFLLNFFTVVYSISIALLLEAILVILGRHYYAIAWICFNNFFQFTLICAVMYINLCSFAKSLKLAYTFS